MKESQFSLLRIYRPEDVPRFDLLDFDLVRMFDQMTQLLGLTKPLKIISTFRTAEENDAAGGAEHSMHLLGKALDFLPSVDPLKIFEAAKEVGFTGIGLYVNDKNAVSIHVDNRPGSHVALWGKLNGVYGTIQPVIDRLKALGYAALSEPAAWVAGLLLTGVLVYVIFKHR